MTRSTRTTLATCTAAALFSTVGMSLLVGGPVTLSGLGAARAEAHGTFHAPRLFSATARRDESQARCSRAERRQALAREQRLVLARLGPLTTLRNEADQALLAARGYQIPAHGYTSLGGMGVTLTPADFLVNPLAPGNPDLLFYEPDPAASDVSDPSGADFPYRLRGWGYITWYDYNQHPTSLSRCLVRDDWFVHERGVHTLDGGMEARPPQEDVHGTAPGNDFAVPSPLNPGVPHPRWWDIHFWLDERVPAVSLLNPGSPIRGVDPHLGEWFFYPPPRAAAGGRDAGQRSTPRRKMLRGGARPVPRIAGHSVDLEDLAKLEIAHGELPGT